MIEKHNCALGTCQEGCGDHFPVAAGQHLAHRRTRSEHDPPGTARSLRTALRLIEAIMRSPGMPESYSEHLRGAHDLQAGWQESHCGTPRSVGGPRNNAELPALHASVANVTVPS